MTYYIIFPDGTRTMVDWAGRTGLRNRAIVRQYPDLFIDAGIDGIMLTDDLDELLSAQELGFEFPAILAPSTH